MRLRWCRRGSSGASTVIVAGIGMLAGRRRAATSMARRAIASIIALR
jgi:hypothetical protein